MKKEIIATGVSAFLMSQASATGYQERTELGGAGTAGVILGFLIFGVFWITAIVIIIIEEKNRHRDYGKMLADAQAEEREFRTKYPHLFAEEDAEERRKQEEKANKNRGTAGGTMNPSLQNQETDKGKIADTKA